MLIGFILLVKGADWLVVGASALAAKLSVPPLVIGLTVVSFGTSLSELVVNIFASLNGNSDIATGNIIGSNNFNMLVILGVSAVIFPLTVNNSTVWKEIPFNFFAIVLLFFLISDYLVPVDKQGLSHVDGCLLLGLFIGFIYYTIVLTRNHQAEIKEVVIVQGGSEKTAFLIILGLACLFLGGKWVVQGAVGLARSLHVSDSMIALTIVAAGTSLPELAASVAAARRKQVDIAVGNVLGSNIFNIFFILGVSSLIRPVQYNPVQNFDMLVCLGVSFILFLFMFTGGRKKFDRMEGIVLLVGYCVYMAILILKSS